MIGEKVWVAAAVAAAVAAGCTPPRTEADRHEALYQALAGAARAQGCAAELSEAAERDPRATAALVGVEPAALAPFGGADRGRELVRGVILGKARAARDAARAARNIALLGEYASAQQDALRREKIARSLADSAALCEAAEGVRSGLLAQRRAPAEADAGP